MEKILGLDLGTNSIGWAVVNLDFENKNGKIIDIGSRIIPMSQDILGKFETGQSVSQTAERTRYRGIRRLYERDNLRRERLHRVLNILGFLPKHYKNEIDFEKKLGQFKKEVKLNYYKNDNGRYEFLFKDSFNEMTKDFPNQKIPYDWTLYYLRKKALSQSLSKEELAWIILNFNQKRGYYQLRGEEDEVKEVKEKTFEVLTVKDLIDTGEKLKKTGEILYKVIFDNGWEYDRPITKTENWRNKTKEYIVSTSKNKDGTIKRIFKAVDSEKDWLAIKRKTEQELDSYLNLNKNLTVATYIYEALLKNSSQKIRGKLIKTIERKYYKDELKKILSKQIELQPTLFTRELYEKSILELYPNNEAHRNNIRSKDFKYLFVEDIIFYQRPLKSKKSTIGTCQYETRSYWKSVRDNQTGEVNRLEVKDEPLTAISKSHPLYQEFRIWQWLLNLHIYQKYDAKGNLVDKDITSKLLQTEDAYAKLFDFLSQRKDIKQNTLLSYFFKKKVEKENHRWNYPEDKTYPLNETRAEMLNRLSKIDTINPNVFLVREIEHKLWHIIFSVKDSQQFKTALRTFAKKNNLPEDAFVKAFEKHPPYKNDYGAYSEKAIKKILPLMRMGKYWNLENIHPFVLDRINKLINGEFDDKIATRVREKAISLNNITDFRGLPLWLTSYIVYNRHSESGDTQQWKRPEDIDNFLNTFKQHSLRNPIVEQVVLETLRTVRDIWKHYGEGKENFFDEIHIELGRELKNPAAVRQKISQKNTENQNTNERIRLLLQEMITDGARPHSPSHQEILKIYEEGVYQNAEKPGEEIEKIRKSNSPKPNDIKKYKLWLEQGYVSPYTGVTIPLAKLFTTDYQIEHIIPQSRYFDDSMNNKVICESAVNELKGNQTAYEFVQKHGGEKVNLGQGRSVEVLRFEDFESHCNRYFKKNKTKLRNLLTEEIPEGFINRQLNDSRYISKLVKSLLGNIVRQKDEEYVTPTNLLPVTGAITSKLKQDWGLNDQWNELILPRFERLNRLTQTKDFTTKNTNGIVIPTVPDKLRRGFSKKRIDHRHHALDALVVACCTRKHIQYINSLNNEKKKYDLQASLMVKNDKGQYTKHFQLPWPSFPTDVKNALETCIVSFKQNLRVINRTNNKYWKYVDGRKQLVRQEGKNFAVRKPLHKETVSGLLKEKATKGKIYTAVRTALSDIKNRKHWDKITDTGIKGILDKHLKNYVNNKGEEDFDRAFSPEGIEELNNNIVALNNGKKHNPIYKVRLKEEGSKFPVSHNDNFHKNKKYVEAAKGSNLYFAIYINEKGERKFETIPLFEAIEHQKQQVSEGIPYKEQTRIPINHNLGKLLFTLSPNDLVYVPTDEEIENPDLVNLNNLTKEQTNRIYKMVSTTKGECHFVPFYYSSPIQKNEMGTNNKNQNTINNEFQIKSRCWKLKVDRLGNITLVTR